MKLTMLGTGNALVTECYNTCFVLEDCGRCLMVDGGGGSTILRQLKHAGYDWMDMRHIFVTHKHVDHLLGIVWMMRVICQSMGHGGYRARHSSILTPRYWSSCATWQASSCGQTTCATSMSVCILSS